MTAPQKKKGRIRNFTAVFVIFLVFFLVFGGAFALYFFKGKTINTRDIRSAEKIMGLTFTPKERRMLLNGTRRNLARYAAIRETDIPNSVPPALQFNPVVEPAAPSEGEADFSLPPTSTSLFLKTGRISPFFPFPNWPHSFEQDRSHPLN